MNIYLRTIYRGRLRDMKRILVVKAMVLGAIACSIIIVFRLVRDVVANHKTTRYAGAATKVIQKNHLA